MLPKPSNIVFSLITTTAIFILFLPKINIVEIEAGGAGIRLDDILLLIIGLALSPSVASRRTLNHLERPYLLFVCLLLASLVLNKIVADVSSFLYAIRFAEYFIFFYLGYYCSSTSKLPTIAWGLLLVNGVTVVLQLTGSLGGFSSAGYLEDVSERPIGLTGGPWEVGATFNFCFAILALHDRKNAARALTLFASTFLLVLLTGARMPTVAHLCVLAYWFYSSSENKPRFAAMAVLLLVPLAALILTIPNPVLERSQNVLSWDNIAQFQTMFATHRPVHDGFRAEYFPQWSNNEYLSDMSWAIRTGKWAFASRMWIDNPLAWALGLGPGIWGLALDGGWLRVATESGLLGLVAFCTFCRRAASLDTTAQALMIVLAVNMLFIDLHMAYKAMSFMLFAIGHIYSTNEQTAEQPVSNGYASGDRFKHIDQGLSHPGRDLH